MKLFFASGNQHKKTEMSRLLGGIDLVLPSEVGLEFDVVEDGKSFVENAIIKAEALYDMVHAPVIADDSGLIVNALGGEPGLRTARYGEDVFGRVLSTKEKYMYLLENMEGIEDRSAEFVCALCLIISPNRRYIIQETAEGKIALAPSGTTGFGYDPVFYNNEAGMISAELPEGDKDLYSHRGKAARILREIIRKNMEE
ncbi:MAG: RdgB/HAM1 family non-canonical purine NTP pyrophosphatase [Spirochaetales bacterium]|nr:RdgB/HAM1 family non-canonical purine NTP pyrophosphatase [Spirochaetales bacterium]MBQ2258779.1 RdgB/HAM1 family non-canonical purine NTP pyrophosphatase [Spirochaetales bacterium]